MTTKRTRSNSYLVSRVKQELGLYRGGRREIATALANKLGIGVPFGKAAQWALLSKHCGVAVGESARRAKGSGEASKSSDDPRCPGFLHSYEWRRLRYTVIKERGAKCEACGRGPKDGVAINADHVKPRKLYPELALDPKNIQVLCEDCNHGKGNWDQTDWREGPPPPTVVVEQLPLPVPVAASEDRLLLTLFAEAGRCLQCCEKATRTKWRVYRSGVVHLVWWCYACERQVGGSCIAPQWADKLGAGPRPKRQPKDPSSSGWSEEDDAKLIAWHARKES